MEEIIKVFGVNWKLLAVQVVNFGILFFVLYRFLYRPLLSFLEGRREKIAQGLKDAEEASAKLVALKGEESEIIRKSLMESEKIIKEAKQRARGEEKSILGDANERSARIIAEGERAAQDEKEKILAGTKEEIARMAVLGAEKIVHKNG